MLGVVTKISYLFIVIQESHTSKRMSRYLKEVRSEPPRHLMQAKGTEIIITLKWEHVCHGGRAVRRPAVLG